MSKPRRIVVIGGGTGTYTVLTGLKDSGAELTAVVTMMDSGGSSGRLRDEFGQLPTGDVRQALVALSKDESTLRALFNYRFDKGDGLEGHSFGNLFLTTLAEVSGGMEQALEETSTILNIQGRVLPVTLSDAHLVAEYEGGLVVKSEDEIEVPKHDGTLRITRLYLEPQASPYGKTLEAISATDLIVIGPGDLYTSLISNLVVPKIAQAICASSARKVFIVNLMTKYGQTFGFTATDFVSEIEKYLGSCLDFVLINNSELPEEIVEKYRAVQDTPVQDDLADRGFKVVREDLLASDPIERASGDKLKRSLIRHDSRKIARVLLSLAE